MSEERSSETQDLISTWLAGDRRGLSVLLERNLPWFRNLVRRRMGRVLRRRMDSADVVQEVALELLRQGPRFAVSDDDRLRRLLVHIVDNVLGHQYDRFTAQRRTVEREQPLPSDGLLEPEIGSDPCPATIAQQREREDWVRIGLKLLSPEDRAVIVLREWHGLPLAEVGRRLGLSADAARMRFQRAIPRLAKNIRRLRPPDGCEPSALDADQRPFRDPVDTVDSGMTPRDLPGER